MERAEEFPMTAGGGTPLKGSAPRKWGEIIPKGVVITVALSGIWLMAFIIFFLIKEGAPILQEASLTEVASGRLWYPASTPPSYGMLPLIAGSVAVTLLSSVIAIPFGVALALFMSEVCPGWAREFCKVSLEIMGFLPSVVLGFIGMVIIAPYMQMKLEILSGLNMLNASFLLGILILPTIATLSEDSLYAVPQAMRDASYALGGTRRETMFKVVLKCASRGIAQAAILGVMRSIGETMVVLMAAGGAAIIPLYVSDPVRPLTSTIAAEMGETPVGSPHYHALFFMGCLLLFITVALNILVLRIESGGKIFSTFSASGAWLARLKARFTRAFHFIAAAPRAIANRLCHERTPRGIGRKASDRLATAMLWGCMTASTAVLGFILAFLVYRGAGAISWEFISEHPRAGMTEGGIITPIVGTVQLIIVSMTFAYPVGVVTAIYFNEYSRGGALTKALRLAVRSLASIPSVVLGLFGFAFFCAFLRFGASLLSAGLTLGCLALPTLVTASETALQNVPQDFRDASYALGATKWQTIYKVVLPSAFPGIITGGILCIGRVAGETAPIMFTGAVFFSPGFARGIFDSVMALPYHIYVLATAGTRIDKTGPLQYGTILVLLALVLGISMAGIIARARLRKRL